MKRAILLIPGWLAITAALLYAIVMLDMRWNFFDWHPTWDSEALAYLLVIAGALLAVPFIARATRDRVSQIASLVVCLALMVAILSLPAEHTSHGLLGRTAVSPLWYRAGRALLLSLPGIFWLWWPLRLWWRAAQHGGPADGSQPLR